jgi:hypothetical protein
MTPEHRLILQTAYCTILYPESRRTIYICWSKRSLTLLQVEMMLKKCTPLWREATLHCTALHYTTLHHTTLNYTTLYKLHYTYYTTPNYTYDYDYNYDCDYSGNCNCNYYSNYNYNYNYNYTTLDYTALQL